MKRILLFANLSLGVLFCNAQNMISTNIYQNNSNLGIGTQDPQHSLEIQDTVDHGEGRYLIKLHNASTYQWATTGIKLEAGENGTVGTLNYTSETYDDPAVEDDGNRLRLGTTGKSIELHVLQPEGYLRFSTGGEVASHPAFERMRITGDGKIGIGTSTPEHTFEIIGSAGNSFPFAVKNNWSASLNLYVASDFDYCHGGITTRRSRGTYDHPLPLIEGDRIMGMFSRSYFDGDYQANASIEMYIGRKAGSGSYSSTIRFLTTSVEETQRYERMRISEDGFVGIGTLDPKAKLQVTDGDIYLSDIEKGIIMKSPDGNCWRGTLDNSGIMHFVQIQCPDDTSPNSMNPETSGETLLKIYPNPSNDIVSIEFPDRTGNTLLHIYTSDGRLLESIHVQGNPLKKDMSVYQQGVYFFQAEDYQGRLLGREKFIHN